MAQSMSESFLCDVCRTNPATHHGVEVEVDGETTEHHLCESCFRKTATSDELETYDRLRQGCCQYCGNRAQIMSQGPWLVLTMTTRQMCFDCDERYKRFAFAESAALSDDLSLDERLSVLRDIDKRVEIYMTSKSGEDPSASQQ